MFIFKYAYISLKCVCLVPTVLFSRKDRVHMCELCYWKQFPKRTLSILHNTEQTDSLLNFSALFCYNLRGAFFLQTYIHVHRTDKK